MNRGRFSSIIKNLSVLFAALLVSACASNIVSSYRAPGVDLKLQGLRIVFEDTPLSVARSVRASDNTVNQQRLLLGNSIVDRMPIVMGENSLSASARSLTSAEIPVSRDFSKYFPETQRSWHVLVIAPVSGSVMCYGGCDFYFRLALRMIEPNTNRVVWSSTIDQPMIGGMGTRKRVYDYFADDVAKVVLKNIDKAN